MDEFLGHAHGEKRRMVEGLRVHDLHHFGFAHRLAAAVKRLALRARFGQGQKLVGKRYLRSAVAHILVHKEDGLTRAKGHAFAAVAALGLGVDGG